MIILDQENNDQHRHHRDHDDDAVSNSDGKHNEETYRGWCCGNNVNRTNSYRCCYSHYQNRSSSSIVGSNNANNNNHNDDDIIHNDHRENRAKTDRKCRSNSYYREIANLFLTQPDDDHPLLCSPCGLKNAPQCSSSSSCASSPPSSCSSLCSSSPWSPRKVLDNNNSGKELHITLGRQQQQQRNDLDISEAAPPPPLDDNIVQSSASAAARERRQYYCYRDRLEPEDLQCDPDQDLPLSIVSEILADMNILNSEFKNLLLDEPDQLMKPQHQSMKNCPPTQPILSNLANNNNSIVNSVENIAINSLIDFNDDLHDAEHQFNLTIDDSYLQNQYHSSSSSYSTSSMSLFREFTLEDMAQDGGEILASNNVSKASHDDLDIFVTCESNLPDKSIQNDAPNSNNDNDFNDNGGLLSLHIQNIALSGSISQSIDVSRRNQFSKTSPPPPAPVEATTEEVAPFKDLGPIGSFKGFTSSSSSVTAIQWRQRPCSINTLLDTNENCTRVANGAANDTKTIAPRSKPNILGEENDLRDASDQYDRQQLADFDFGIYNAPNCGSFSQSSAYAANKSIRSIDKVATTDNNNNNEDNDAFWISSSNVNGYNSNRFDPPPTFNLENDCLQLSQIPSLKIHQNFNKATLLAHHSRSQNNHNIANSTPAISNSSNNSSNCCKNNINAANSGIAPIGLHHRRMDSRCGSNQKNRTYSNNHIYNNNKNTNTAIHEYCINGRKHLNSHLLSANATRLSANTMPSYKNNDNNSNNSQLSTTAFHFNINAPIGVKGAPNLSFGAPRRMAAYLCATNEPGANDHQQQQPYYTESNTTTTRKLGQHRMCQGSQASMNYFLPFLRQTNGHNQNINKGHQNTKNNNHNNNNQNNNDLTNGSTSSSSNNNNNNNRNNNNNNNISSSTNRATNSTAAAAAAAASNACCKLYSFCTFCKNNGESEAIYATHYLKDQRGLVTCPILRAYTCPICGQNGDRAHTVKYCPLTSHMQQQQSSSSASSKPTASNNNNNNSNGSMPCIKNAPNDPHAATNALPAAYRDNNNAMLTDCIDRGTSAAAIKSQHHHHLNHLRDNKIPYRSEMRVLRTARTSAGKRRFIT